MASPKLCSVENCGKPFYCKGFCESHYGKFRRCGSPLGRVRVNGCVVQDCGAKVYGHGYCSRHYQRWVRHGDPLGGGTPRGCQLLLKFVSEVALPYEGEDCLIWPYGLASTGYGMMERNGQRQTAHRVVCAMAHGEPPSERLDARHKCGIRSCVNPRHLEWGTRQQNMQDKLRHGTAPRGENNGHAKLTEANVRWIRDFGTRMPRKELVEMFGASRQAICHVLMRRTWNWLK